MAIRFHRAFPGDASLREHLAFDLPPLPDEGRSSESVAEDNDVDNDVEIEPGQMIGSCTVVLEVRSITAGATHVICFVVKSLDNDYITGTERVLTMAAFQLLYIEYHIDG
jgi:hypothetical protein